MCFYPAPTAAFPNLETELLKKSFHPFYARETTEESCLQYVKLHLPTTVTRNASCPFEAELCKLEQGNIVFDTGYLDSHEHLGINTRPEDRVQFRRVTSCAPLVTEGRTETNHSNALGKNVTRYHYGSSTGYRENTTHAYTDISETEFDVGRHVVGGLAYNIDVFDHFPFNGTTYTGSTFEPIPELGGSESDTALVSLSANNVIYVSEVDDPWYSAHRRMGSTTMTFGAKGQDSDWKIIAADEAASPLACKVQTQYCNPNLAEGSRCTPLGPTVDARMLAEGLWEGERQMNVLGWILMAFSNNPNAGNVAGALTNQALLSRFSMQAGTQGPLPDNQWQTEVEYWHNITMAYMQSVAVSIARGPSSPTELNYVIRSNNTEEHELCKNQKVYSRAHFNFSIFWLALTLALGALLILLSYTLEPLVAFLQRRLRRRRADPYARLEWATNETLQLQRLAHEELGVGAWKGCLGAVPVTADARQRLAVLDVQDPEHPRLKAPVAGFEECGMAVDSGVVAAQGGVGVGGEMGEV